MAIVYRNTKGSTLTHSELDNNFADLDGRISATLDSDKVKRFTLDSSEVIGIIDSAYINLRATDNLDSAEVIALIDSAYVQARQTTAYLDSDLTKQLINDTYRFLDSDTVSGVVDSSYVQSRYTESISLSTLQTELAASDSFGAFQIRIAAL